MNFIIAGSALVAFLYFVYVRYFKVPDEIKILPSAPFFGALFSYITQPNLTRVRNFYFPLLHKYGLMRFWFQGSWSVIISDPELLQQVFLDQELGEKVTFDDNPHSIERSYYGTNIIFSKVDEWRRHRKVVAPAFKRDWPTEVFATSASQINEKLFAANQEPVRILSIVEKGALDALGKIGFNYDFEAMKNGKNVFLGLYHKAITVLWNPWFILFPFLERIPFPYRLEARKASDKFRGLIDDMLVEMRNKINRGEHTSDDNKSDVLSLMIKATNDTDTGKTILSDSELINNTLIFFAAGHDTSSNTMSFLFYYLATHLVFFNCFDFTNTFQDIQDKVRNELCRVLEISKENLGKGEDIVPTQNQVRQMIYLNAVIHEAMRMAPTTPEVPRIIGRDWDLGNGAVLVKGTKVLLQYYASMNDPKIWKNPDEFDPERFLKRTPGCNDLEVNKEIVKKLSIFGGGSRMCIGATFALVMQKVMLSVMLQKFRVSLPADSKHNDGLITNRVGLCSPAELDVIFTPLA